MQDYSQEKASLMQHDKGFISLSSAFSSAAGPEAWKNPSLGEAAASATASSCAVISPGGSSVGQESPASGENSDQSGSTLKEHDYIGLAEVSSLSHLASEADDRSQDLNLEETDLRLGLGPVKKNEPLSEIIDGRQDAGKVGPDSRKQVQEPLPHSLWQNSNSKSSADCAAHVASTLNVAATVPHGFQAAPACMPVQDYAEVATPRAGNAYETARFVPPTPKNGVKRGYQEAMSDVARFGTRAGDADLKVLPKLSQASLLPSRSASKTTMSYAWQVGLDQASGSSYPLNKPSGMLISRVEKPGDCAATAYKPSDNLQDTAITNDAPPSKGAVIGWPPIRSYRKNNLAKPAEMYVKVNMDGITVGRKVDLNAHSSYDGLLSALEDMFQPSNNVQGTSHATGRESLSSDGKHFRLMNGSEFVLTYEDKDGDWMLVGDVPWSMFVNTVRRLRIMRGSETTNLDNL